MAQGHRLTALFYLFLIILSVGVFWPLPSDQERYAEGVAAANRGAYETAYTIWKRLAEGGYPRAQYALAALLEQGKGVKQDLPSAARWYEKAARQQVWEAQVNLGLMLVAGSGVETDLKAAAEWFRKAAEQGSAEGQVNLGQLYLRGLGVERDPATAARWFAKAARRGHGMAQYTLATLYADGVGVAQDAEEAYFWSALAAQSEGVIADTALAFSRRLARDFNEAQLTALRQRVTQWQPDASGVDAEG